MITVSIFLLTGLVALFLFLSFQLSKRCYYNCSQYEEEARTKILKENESKQEMPLLVSIDQSTPFAIPLTSVSSLDSWVPSRLTAWNKCRTPLIPRNKSATGISHIVCHDMMGGYKEDSNVEGVFFSSTNTPNTSSMIRYTFQYWHLIDSFIYFSHNRITIPPSSWVASGHRNGVPVLGTIIVEGNTGTSEIVLLIKANSQSWSKRYADILISIAIYYGFDGWFFNFESNIAGTSCSVEDIKSFLNYMRNQIKLKIPGGLVVWYDSLDISGYINYQNCLNDRNLSYFQNSDKIFTNYWWNTQLASLSYKTATKSGPPRNFDVQMGLDVWGRGTFGGGKMNSYVAFAAANNSSVGIGTFGFAWTYEGRTISDYLTTDYLFWNGWDGNNQSSQIGVSNWVVERVRPTMTYFYSDFNLGYGNTFVIQGQTLLWGFWHHIGLQSITPSYSSSNSFMYFTKSISLNSSRSDLQTTFMTLDTQLFSTIGPSPCSWQNITQGSYNGGSCIKITVNLTSSNPKWNLALGKLFTVNMNLNNGDIILANVYRPVSGFQIGVYWKDATNRAGVLLTTAPMPNTWEKIEYSYSGPTINIVELGLCVYYTESSPFSGAAGYIGDIAVTPQSKMTTKCPVNITEIIPYPNTSTEAYTSINWFLSPTSDLSMIKYFLLFEACDIPFNCFLGVSILTSYSFLKSSNPTEKGVLVVPVDVFGKIWIYNAKQVIVSF